MALVSAVVVLVSSQANAIQDSAGAQGAAGELILSLAADFPGCAHCFLAERRNLAQATGRPILDHVRSTYGISAMEPLFGGVHAASSHHAALTRFRSRAARAAAGTNEEYLPDLSQVYLISVRPDTDLAKLASDLQRDPAVQWVEPNYIYRAAARTKRSRVARIKTLFDDPFLRSSGSWGQDFPDLWGVFQIRAPTAWLRTTGRGAVVAIVDTGIDIEHPDLSENVWTNLGEVAGNGIDDDSNGFADDVSGWDFTRCVELEPSNGSCSQPKEPGGDLRDPVGHGTHIAGIVAAVGDNGIGIVGVAPHARVMAVRGLDRSGSGLSRDLAEAIVYAAENGANVINASWSGPPSHAIEMAVKYATAGFDAVLVASVDNGGVPLERGRFPANLPEVLAVGAITQTDTHPEFSNFGGPLDMVAPGGGDLGPSEIIHPDQSILSLLADQSDFGRQCEETSDKGIVCETAPWVVADDYVREAGTSMAAGFVSGVAALVRSADPTLDYRQVRQTLLQTAIDLGPPGWDPQVGYGRIDAGAALGLTAVPVAEITVPENSAKVRRAVLPLVIRGTAASPSAPLRRWTLKAGGAGTAHRRVVSEGNAEVVDGVLGILKPRRPLLLRLGRRYVLELTVEDVTGNIATTTKEFLVPAPRYGVVPIPDRFDEGGEAKLSADGTRFVISRVDRDRHETRVWTFDSATRELRLLGDGSGVRISPDGNSTVFTQGFTPTTILSDFATDSRTLLPGGILAGPLTLPPTKILFVSSDNPVDQNADHSDEAFVVDVTTNELRQITQGVAGRGTGVDDFRLAVSSDGRRALFTSSEDLDGTHTTDGLQQAFLYDADTRQLCQLTGRPGFPPAAFFPSMSSDGSMVVLELEGVHLIDVARDVSATLVSADLIAFPAQPRLSGDGTRVFFVGTLDLDRRVANEDLGPEVFLFDLATGHISQVTDTVRAFGAHGLGEADLTANTVIVDFGGGELNGVSLHPPLVRAVTRRQSNRLPRLDVPSVIVAQKGLQSRTTLSAYDPDGDPLTFYAERVPPFVVSVGMRLRDLANSELIDYGNGSAELVFTPDDTPVGRYPLQIAVFDEQGDADVHQATLLIQDIGEKGIAN